MCARPVIERIRLMVRTRALSVSSGLDLWIWRKEGSYAITQKGRYQRMFNLASPFLGRGSGSSSSWLR